MDSKEADFFAKLLTTFKIEANEHLANLSNGLLSLESNLPPAQNKETIETVFREMHSLKGAARAVNQYSIESVCQSAEDVLAALKQELLPLSKKIFDALYETLDFIKDRLESPQQESEQDQYLASSLKEKLLACKVAIDPSIQSTEQPIQGPLETQNTIPTTSYITDHQEPTLMAAEEKHESIPNPVESALNDTASAQSSHTKLQSSSLTAEKTKSTVISSDKTSNTFHTDHSLSKGSIRISVSKLEKLLQQIEELLTIKITGSHQLSAINNIQLLIDQWEKNWQKVLKEIRGCKDIPNNALATSSRTSLLEVSMQTMDFLEGQIGFCRSLKSQIQLLVKNRSQDHRVMSTMIDSALIDTKAVLMQPFSTLLEAVPRMVRDIAGVLGKQVHLELSGQDIEVDRRILEDLKDPLFHLIRNAIDHGIEQPDERMRKGKNAEGNLKISACRTHGKTIEICIQDDGEGIDPEKIKQVAIKNEILSEKETASLTFEEAVRLIFRSGISTSPIITDISGRGIGLGIVAEKVEKLGGQIVTESKLGVGTTFKILLPPALATFRGVHVRISDHEFIIPILYVKHVLRLKTEEIRKVEGRNTIFIDGKALSLISLQDILGIPSNIQKKSAPTHVVALVIKALDTTAAFVIDELITEQEVFVKSLGSQLLKVKNISAATITEWGKVVPILEPFDLIKSLSTNTYTPSPEGKAITEESSQLKTILLAEDSVTARILIKNILESAGYQVKTAVDGLEAFTMLQENHIDLLLSDVEMPRMNGFELTKKVRGSEKFKNLPVVLCTSRGSKEDRETGISIGANAYMDKNGFQQSKLLDVIQKLL